MENIGNLYIYGNRNQKKIAFTFDDGPCNETNEILKILKKYNVKATFFVLGKKIKGNEDILKQIITQGCEIGNHSENHYALWWKSKRFIEKEILETDKKLEVLKIKTEIFRPPYMRFGLNLLIVCKKLNKKIIWCDVISDDWKFLKKEIIIRKVLKKVKNGSIISFHDYVEDYGQNRSIANIIKELVPKLKSKYELVTVSEILN